MLHFKLLVFLVGIAAVRPQGFTCEDNYLPDNDRIDCAPGSPTSQVDCMQNRNCTWCPTIPDAGIPWCYRPMFGTTTTTTTTTTPPSQTTINTGPTTTTQPPVGGNCGITGHNGGSTIVIRGVLTTRSPILTEFWDAQVWNVQTSTVQPHAHNKYLSDYRNGNRFWLSTAADFRLWQQEQGNNLTIRRTLTFGCVGGGSTDYSFQIEMAN